MLVLKFEYEKLKKLIFGAKSERFVAPDPNQMTLDLEFGQVVVPEPEKETISYSRSKPDSEKKNGHARLELPSHLPRVQEEIHPENLPEGAKCIGKKITSVLEYTPGKVFIRDIIRYQYLIEQQDESKIVIPSLPPLPIPRGNAGASFIAHTIVSKVIDHLPFYRQCQIHRREQKFFIAESVLTDNFHKGCKLLNPLFEDLRQRIRSSRYLMVDETPIPVLGSDKPGSTHQGYFWVFYSPPEKLVCFVYHRSRGQDAPRQFLENYQGALQTDGYAVYDKYENRPEIILLACMAHCRRYFFESKGNDKKRSEKALEFFQRLYSIEQVARENHYSSEERKNLRQAEAVPIMAEFRVWLDEQLLDIVPKSPFGKAVVYTLKMWNRLVRYTEEGHYEIDNNPVENSIRPVALGRKNYLFAGSHEAAQRLAMMYSLLTSCKMQGINPHEWLTDVLTRIQDTKTSELVSLLPSNWQPSSC